MPRTKNTVAGRARRKRVLKQTDGYRGTRGTLYRTARETLDRALVYAYRDRKQGSATSGRCGSRASTPPLV
jgi:large subunit ribosomal protein L20